MNQILLPIAVVGSPALECGKRGTVGIGAAGCGKSGMALRCSAACHTL